MARASAGVIVDRLLARVEDRRNHCRGRASCGTCRGIGARLRERPVPSPPARGDQSNAESRHRRHAIDPLLGGARRASRRLKAASRRAAQPACLRDVQAMPPQRHLRRPAQGSCRTRSPSSVRAALHPAAEGRLCGRPAPAMQRVAADGPRARSGSAAAGIAAPCAEARPAGSAAAGRRRPVAGAARARWAEPAAQAEGQAAAVLTARLICAAHRARAPPRRFRQTLMSSAHGCTLAGEVSPAGVFCVLRAFDRRENVNVRQSERSARQRIRQASRARRARRRPTCARRCARCASRCSRPTSRCRSRAISSTRSPSRRSAQEVLRSVTPGQMVVKIVHDALVEMLGSETVGAQPRRQSAGGDHDGRPPGLGQDDDHRQARQAADRARAQEGADGLARRRPPGGAGAAGGARAPGERRHAADRRRPAAGRDRQARDPGGEAAGL